MVVRGTEPPAVGEDGPSSADVAAALRDRAALAAAATRTPPMTPESAVRLVPEHVDVAPPPRAYRARLAAVAVATLLLPLVYLSLIAICGLALWWLVTEGWRAGPNGRRSVQFFGTAVGVNLFVLVFLLKPLLAPRKRRPRPCALTPEDEPALYAFVASIAAAVRAPRPVRIDVDHEVNASASLRRGWLSLFVGDLVLTVGTPLFAGMTVTELGGVIAHELGHFRQGWGMRASFAIRSVNAWLHRAANDPDEWDEKLTQEGGWNIALIAAGGCIAVTRHFLGGLMRIGVRLHAALSRHMEIDADEHELALVGSEAFASAMRRLALLQVADAQALEMMAEIHQEGRLPRCAVDILTHVGTTVPPETVARVLAAMLDEPTDELSSHPCVKERLRHAAERACAPKLQSTIPARALLSDSDALFERVTLWAYQEIVGIETDGIELEAGEELIGRIEHDRAAFVAFRGVTAGVVGSCIPFDPRGGSAGDDDPRVGARDARNRLEQCAEETRRVVQRIDAASWCILQATRCRDVREAGGDPRALENIDLRDRSPGAISAALARARDEVERLASSVEPAHAVLRDRLACVRACMSDDTRERTDALMTAAGALAAELRAVQELRLECCALDDLIAIAARGQVDGPERALTLRAARTEPRLAALRSAWKTVPHPISHSEDSRTLSSLVAEPDEELHPAVGRLVAARATVRAAISTYHGVLAELCWMVEQTEEA